MKWIPYIASLALLLAGCKKPSDRKCWKSHGDTISETRDVGTFNHLAIDDHMMVVLIEDSVHSVEVEAGENTISFVETLVELDTLKLSDHNKCGFLRSYKQDIRITISAPDLSFIRQRSTGDIESPDTLHYPSLHYRGKFSSGNTTLILDTDSSTFHVETGPADLYLSGQADYVYIYHSGNGYAYATNLLAQTVHVSNASTGDFHVNAALRLIVELNGTGDVYYRGAVSNGITSGGEGPGQLFEE